MKYSSNKKLQTVLSGIEEQILQIGDGDAAVALAEIARYKKNFPKEPDYNLAQYGNLLVYYSDIYDFYRAAGYKSTDKFSADKIWATYLRQVGYVAREILREAEQKGAEQK